MKEKKYNRFIVWLLRRFDYVIDLEVKIVTKNIDIDQWQDIAKSRTDAAFQAQIDLEYEREVVKTQAEHLEWYRDLIEEFIEEILAWRKDARLRSTNVVDVPKTVELNLDEKEFATGKVVEGSRKMRGWKCSCQKKHEFHVVSCPVCLRTRPAF